VVREPLLPTAASLQEPKPERCALSTARHASTVLAALRAPLLRLR
jgi:hypothetical protein